MDNIVNTNEELRTILNNFSGWENVFNANNILYKDLILFPDKKSGFDIIEQCKVLWAGSAILDDRYSSADFLRYIYNHERLNDKEFIESAIKRYEESIKEIENANKNAAEDAKAWYRISMKYPNKKENDMKFYLSVDNSSLHTFAFKFLQECLDNGLQDVNFKINNNEDLNRRDNVVIYCNEDNIEIYYDMINETMLKNPGIKLNSPHLLGIMLNDYIALGIDEKNEKNEPVSYTEVWCNTIIDSLQNKVSPDDIADSIEKMKYLILERINNNSKEINNFVK